MSELNVLQKVVVKRWVGKLENGLGDIVPRCFNGDVVVLLEVDTGLLLSGIIHYTEELALEARVGRAGNVFTISPLSVTASTSSTGACGRGVAIGVLIEATLGPIPAAWTTTTGSEVGGIRVGPVATRTRAIASVTVRSVHQK